MRLIDADELLKYKNDNEMVSTHLIYYEPTVDAVPISFIKKRIEQLKNHADYEFEENGGYAGGSQYRLWELECLLDAWMRTNADG